MIVTYTCSLDDEDDDGDDDIDVFAYLNGHKVGEAVGNRVDERLKLANIWVDDGVEPPRPPGMTYLPDRRKPVDCRGMGIGRELLRRFLAAADAAGVAEVWGDVTDKDIQATPHLLAWYERNGFVVTGPGEDSIVTAVKMIVRRRT